MPIIKLRSMEWEERDDVADSYFRTNRAKEVRCESVKDIHMYSIDWFPATISHHVCFQQDHKASVEWASDDELPKFRAA